MGFTNISSKARQQIQKTLWKENEKYSQDFVELDVNKVHPPDSFSLRPVRAYRNNRFLVQVFEEKGFTRLTVNRTSINSKGDWLDGISWDELFEIKNRLGFSNYDAVEVFPAQSKLVNVGNLRHLWIVTHIDLPFIWGNK